MRGILSRVRRPEGRYSGQHLPAEVIVRGPDSDEAEIEERRRAAEAAGRRVIVVVTHIPEPDPLPREVATSERGEDVPSSPFAKPSS